jgi:hypothetical protein
MYESRNINSLTWAYIFKCQAAELIIRHLHFELLYNAGAALDSSRSTCSIYKPRELENQESPRSSLAQWPLQTEKAPAYEAGLTSILSLTVMPE